MTEQELAEIAARHRPTPVWCYWRGANHNGGEPPHYRHTHGEQECHECSTDDFDQPWPCDAARLLEHYGYR